MTILYFQVICDLLLRTARRGRENLNEFKVGDFAVTRDSEGDLYLYNVIDEQEKNHQEDDSTTSSRMWEIKGNLTIVIFLFIDMCLFIVTMIFIYLY